MFHYSQSAEKRSIYKLKINRNFLDWHGAITNDDATEVVSWLKEIEYDYYSNANLSNNTSSLKKTGSLSFFYDKIKNNKIVTYTLKFFQPRNQL